MAIFNSFTFDGENSLDYGVYITGEAVWNAPERDMELVSIPGRNGALAIDNGRYENITVTYPAGVFANSMEEYAAKIRAFRNVLASRFTYAKLTDTYNPDEYRIGLFRAGLEADPVMYNTAGEFDITFECKPQRWLNSGDEPVEIFSEPDVLTDHNLDPITNEAGVPIDVNSTINRVINPTNNVSRPIIIAPEPGLLRIGNVSVSIMGDGSKPIYIDCELMEAYTINQVGAIESANDLVRFEPNEYPELQPGENNFMTTIYDIQIIPKWWIL